MARRGVTVSREALTIDEGSTGSYTVVLDSEPTGAVQEYRNDPGLPAPAIADGTAFRACAR